MTAILVEDLNEVLSLSPMVRWVGGKRWLAPKLAPEILAIRPRLYIEPFLGGGAVALALPFKLPKILADINPQLIDCWLCVKRAARSLLVELDAVEKQYGNDEEGYLLARDEFNFMVRNPRPMWIRRSAVFLYLNARCFNGLWRTNRKGLFNVPFGKLTSPKRIDASDLGLLSANLFNADLRCVRFDELLSYVLTRYRNCNDVRYGRRKKLEGVAIYADPPYHGTFSSYDKDGFDDNDQRDLAEVLEMAVAAGASIWATNADTQLVREIYSWAKIEAIDEHHSVGSTGDRRGRRGCLLIRGGAGK
jgi:DNA adenine methylase